MLRSRYNFVDISIFLRVKGNEYVNLTDYTFTNENEQVILNDIDSEYAIMFCSFMKKERYASEITVPELLTLADIKNQQFARQIACGIDDDISQQLIAIMCAKKIIDYAYGRCVRVDDTAKIAYAFQRQKFVDRKRVYPTVLTKEFRLV